MLFASFPSWFAAREPAGFVTDSPLNFCALSAASRSFDSPENRKKRNKFLIIGRPTASRANPAICMARKIRMGHGEISTSVGK